MRAQGPDPESRATLPGDLESAGAPREAAPERRRQATHHGDEATSEESTTEGVDAGGWNASAAREQRRARRRLTRHLAEAAAAAAVGQNFLERRSVSAATLATYEAAVARFHAHARRHGRQLRDDEGVDASLVACFTEEYFRGRHPSAASAHSRG